MQNRNDRWLVTLAPVQFLLMGTNFKIQRMGIKNISFSVGAFLSYEASPAMLALPINTIESYHARDCTWLLLVESYVYNVGVACTLHTYDTSPPQKKFLHQSFEIQSRFRFDLSDSINQSQMNNQSPSMKICLHVDPFLSASALLPPWSRFLLTRLFIQQTNEQWTDKSS